MWSFNDASRIGVPDMDSRRAYNQSYEERFDACDPLSCVLDWSGRGPARVLRRRCRSEGVDRSPYEDVTREPQRSADYHSRYQRVQSNKSHFTLNNGYERNYERFNHECLLPAPEFGDYLMAHEHNRHHGYQPGRSKFLRLSPTRPLIVSAFSNTKIDDNRLPKVEELLEKVDHEMMEVAVAKQPLKSILNNPIQPVKSPPQGILKKPKTKSQDQKAIEGRRRQRASSESDNMFNSFHIGSPIPGYDSRLYQSNAMKRAKDNSGTGYSYGSAIATLTTAPTGKTPSQYKRCACKDQVIVANKDGHILRTSAINNSTIEDNHTVNMPRHDTPTCPVMSPALPVSSVTAGPATKKKTLKKKTKSKIKSPKANNKMECTIIDGETDDGHSRSPSPDPIIDSAWQMETDALLLEMEKFDKRPLSPVKKEEPVLNNSISKVNSKSNGVVPAPVKKISSKDSPMNIPDSLSSFLRASMFPRVPPYLKFVGHEESPNLKIPNPIQKHLKWKLTTITPIVVKKTLTNSGFRLVKSECDTAECPQEETVEWIGIWGKHMKSLMFRAIKDGQKMNHFPGTFQIGRKDRLWRNLQKLVARYGIKEFGIMPKTYVLPHDLKLLKHDWEKYSANNERWIIKPPASARGTGIKVVSRWTQIPKKRAVVVQKYVSKPYLINGNKFDMRLYVLVTSIHPLRIYLFKDGLARFASVKYNDDITSLNDRYMHLTNYSINRLSKNYTPNEDFAACEGHKWTLQTLFQYLKTEKEVDTDALWESMKDLVIKTIISGEASISSLTKANITSRYNCYELFGIDVLLDEDLKPWLLEVNISPSLHSASPLDIHVKGPLVSAVLNVAQFHVPAATNVDLLSREKPNKLASLPYDHRLYTVYLSKEERDKHIIYTNMEERDMYLRDILSTLTPDDVRHLVQAEDEFSQRGELERIFPTRRTHRYLAYLTGPRYYNRLFDAWESRYGDDRPAGVELLRRLCEIGYHLEVPPVPLKRAAPQLSALDRCRMTWMRRRRPRPSDARVRRSGPWRRPSPCPRPRPAWGATRTTWGATRPILGSTRLPRPRARPCVSPPRSPAHSDASSAPSASHC